MVICFIYVVNFYLFRLYKSLGEYDVVRGIFSGQVGTKDVTKRALEAEQRTDYLDALQNYGEVSGNWD